MDYKKKYLKYKKKYLAAKKLYGGSGVGKNTNKETDAAAKKAEEEAVAAKKAEEEAAAAKKAKEEELKALEKFLMKVFGDQVAALEKIVGINTPGNIEVRVSALEEMLLGSASTGLLPDRLAALEEAL
jgi:hypothetical protein